MIIPVLRKMAPRNKMQCNITIANYYWLLIVVITTTLSDAQSSEREWKLGFTGKVKWSESCDFRDGDYAKVFDNWQVGKCEKLCVADERCTHFTSSKVACYLKTFEQPFVMEQNLGRLDLGTICGFAINRVLFQLIIIICIYQTKWLVIFCFLFYEG